MSTIIHIGMQKTGTTFLQNALFEHRVQLLAHNILYQSPLAGIAENDGETNAHHWLAHAMQGKRKHYTPPADFTLLDQHVTALNHEKMRHPHAVSILSSEDFSEFNTRSIRHLRRLFPDQDTRILVYLRRQDLWLDSYYAQLVKVGRNVSTETLYTKEKWRLNYLSWLDTWARHFGSDNIIVRTYEGFGPDKSIWDDFLGAIGRPGASQVRPAMEVANQSLAYELTLFSKAQNIYGDQRSLRHVLDNLNGRFSQRSGLKYISEEMGKKILADSAETNDLVAQKYLGRSKLFQDEQVVSSAEGGTLSVEQLAQVVGGISITVLSRMNKLEKQLRTLEEQLTRPRVSYPLLYATRSLLPSDTANSVQSSHMACVFDQLHTDFTAVYRSRATAADTVAHFAPYGLTPPRRTHTLRSIHPWLDWTHLDLAAFRAIAGRQPRNTIVYSRSVRLSWMAASEGLTTFIELHDPLTRAKTAWLGHLLKSRRTPGLVATTTRLKADLLAAFPFLTDKHILVAGGGASSALLDLPALTLPDAGAFNIGYAGSAFRGKGIEVLLACAARLPGMTFHIIGPDQETCAPLGVLSPNVIFHGRKPHPETIGLLKSMDALLLPNQRSVIIRSGADIGAHTSPLKLFEYLATGRPIIASNLPVFRGILRDRENAFLTPPEDIDGFCRHLRQLEVDPGLGQPLGLQARLDFAAHHTWEHRAKRILDFITHHASGAT